MTQKAQHSQQEQIVIKNQLLHDVCVNVCMLVLYPFIFHCTGDSEPDLCSECKSKWNNLIIVLWTAISAIWGSTMKIVIQREE